MENNANELLQFSSFLMTLRKAITDRKYIEFIDSSMCILKPYYIKIEEESIKISAENIGGKEVRLVITNDSSLSFCYCSFRYLLEDIYSKRCSRKQLMKKVKFLIHRVANRIIKIVDEVNLPDVI